MKKHSDVALNYSPRVRIEWLVAVARVVLASGALIAVLLGPIEASRTWSVAYLLCWYLVFSAGVLALVWSPIRFARGGDIALHVFDLFVFSALMVVTDGAPGPFFIALVFLLICGAIRWQLRGTLWTAAAVMAAYGLISAYAATVLDRTGFDPQTFVIRAVYLAVVTVLVGYLGAHQRRFHAEISQLAAWPRTMSREPHEVLSEVLLRAARMLNAPRIMLAWADPDGPSLNLAWLNGNEGIEWVQEPETTYEPLVPRALDGRIFQAASAPNERGRVVALTAKGFMRRRCRPIHGDFIERFGIRNVQSWPINGDLVRGWLFCLDKAKMPLDDLIFGEFVARLATSRLDSMYLLERLHGASVLDERVRVARDLHDSLLQAQAGAALQLLSARRLLDRDLAAAKKRLDEVQQQLERGEIEMRSFIRGLRPRPSPSADASSASLRDRLHDLKQTVERRWSVRVALTLDPSIDDIPAALSAHIFKLVQEGVSNAARHADASAIAVGLALAHNRVQVSIADDGRGFPFSGKYDLAALGRMNKGPLTLKERVSELNGELTLRSTTGTGTALHMTVPLTRL